MPIQVRSEILPLKRVLLHRPGLELEHLVPDTLERKLSMTVLPRCLHKIMSRSFTSPSWWPRRWHGMQN